MTTIIGIQGEDYTLIGTDTRISSIDGDGMAYQVSTLATGHSKIATTGRYLLGAAGDMRAINLLHHAFTPPIPTPTLTGKRLDKFITLDFIPALRTCFEEHGYSQPQDSGQHIAEQGSNIIVSINARLYIIENDYSWTSDTQGIYAIGTGAPYALGAAQALKPTNVPTPTQAKQLATKALTIAAKYDPHTGPPIHTYTQTR